MRSSYVRWSFALEVAALVFLGLSFLTPVLSWGSLPETIPIHFGASGTPDGWGSKSTLLLSPGVSVALYLGLTVLVRFPRTFNYPVRVTEENRKRQEKLAILLLKALKAETLGMFAFIEWGMVRAAATPGQGLGQAFIYLALLVLFATIGGYFVVAARAK